MISSAEGYPHWMVGRGPCIMIDAKIIMRLCSQKVFQQPSGNCSDGLRPPCAGSTQVIPCRGARICRVIPDPCVNRISRKAAAHTPPNEHLTAEFYGIYRQASSTLHQKHIQNLSLAISASPGRFGPIAHLRNHAFHIFVDQRATGILDKVESGG